MLTQLTRMLTVAGKPGTVLGAQLEALRAGGPRTALRQARAGDPRDALAGAFYDRVWREAAAELGADIVELGGEYLELRLQGHSTRVWRQLVQLDDSVSLQLAADKPLAHRLLAEAGLPVPEHVEFDVRDVEAPLEFLRAGGPCVVKPARGTAVGAGVTGGVTNTSSFLRARLLAARWDSQLLIERQLDGDVHRLLILDGELIDTVRRLRPTVVGDGRSSVRKLIDLENTRRREALGAEGLSLLRIDLDTAMALRAQGLTLGSVPADGERVTVKTVANQNRLEDNEQVAVRAEIADKAISAAEVVGLRLAGVDMLGGTVLEVNGTPGFNQHYHVAQPSSSSRVAVPVLRTLLS